jgi:hypothetical protein
VDRATNPRGAIAVTATSAAAATAAGARTGTATTTTAAAAFSGGGLVDADHAAHPLHILQVVDGALLGIGIRQVDQSKAEFATRFPLKWKAE